MAKAVIIYFSKSGNTEKMAGFIAEGLNSGYVDASAFDVNDVSCDILPSYDCIVLGSPTYYGSMASQIKDLLDTSVKFHGKLDGKVGGAFSSSNNIAGGNETTVNDMLNALLIHGMIIQGDPKGDHYGPVSIGAPDSRVKDECIRYGKRLAKLTKKCF